MYIHKKSLIAVTTAILALTSTKITSAHERRVFQIGNTPYVFVVGSLGEPTFVDDKSGVDLRISKGDRYNPTNFEEYALQPVVGLEKTLRVEVAAGSKKKTFSLSPVYKTPGAYSAIFYPTVATTYTYRVFGTIDETPIDVSFTCASGEVDHNATNNEKKEISEKMTQIYKSGAFGCPQDHDGVEFPEKTLTQAQTAQKLGKLAQTDAVTGIALALAAAAFVYNHQKNKQPKQ